MKLNEIRRKILSDLGESSDLTLFEGRVGETPCLYAAFEALLDKEPNSPFISVWVCAMMRSQPFLSVTVAPTTGPLLSTILP